MRRIGKVGLCLEEDSTDVVEAGANFNDALEAELARSSADMGEESRAMEELSDQMDAASEHASDLIAINDVVESSTNDESSPNQTDMKMASVAVESIRVKLGLSERKVSMEAFSIYIPADITRSVIDAIKRILKAIVDGIARFCEKIASFFKKSKAMDAVADKKIEQTKSSIEQRVEEKKTSETPKSYKEPTIDPATFTTLAIGGEISPKTIEQITDNVKTAAKAVKQMSTMIVSRAKEFESVFEKVKLAITKEEVNSLLDPFKLSQELRAPLEHLCKKLGDDLVFQISDREMIIMGVNDADATIASLKPRGMTNLDTRVHRAEFVKDTGDAKGDLQTMGILLDAGKAKDEMTAACAGAREVGVELGKIANKIRSNFGYFAEYDKHEHPGSVEHYKCNQIALYMTVISSITGAFIPHMQAVGYGHSMAVCGYVSHLDMSGI